MCLLKNISWRLFEIRGSRSSNIQEKIASEIAWLKDHLQDWPTWILGHLQLGELSLKVSDFGTAYASARAALELKPSPSCQRRAEKLLGLSHLRAGQAQEALGILEGLLEKDPNDFSLLEDLAAAYIAIGDTSKAKETLLKTPSEKLSFEGQATLRYLETRNTMS